jgi:hypothetical protein
VETGTALTIPHLTLWQKLVAEFTAVSSLFTSSFGGEGSLESGTAQRDYQEVE